MTENVLRSKGTSIHKEECPSNHLYGESSVQGDPDRFIRPMKCKMDFKLAYTSYQDLVEQLTILILAIICLHTFLRRLSNKLRP